MSDRYWMKSEDSLEHWKGKADYYERHYKIWRKLYDDLDRVDSRELYNKLHDFQHSLYTKSFVLRYSPDFGGEPTTDAIDYIRCELETILKDSKKKPNLWYRITKFIRRRKILNE